jgi:hypothetical protein
VISGTALVYVRYSPKSGHSSERLSMSALCQKRTFQHALQVGFDALKMYRVAAEKIFFRFAQLLERALPRLTPIGRLERRTCQLNMLAI